MEQSQPTERLLTDDLVNERTGHLSNAWTIRRKQIPNQPHQTTLDVGGTAQMDHESQREVPNNTTPHWQSVSTEDPDNHHDAHKPWKPFARHSQKERSQGGMHGRKRHISLLLMFLVLPLLGITTALLVVIYKKLLPQSHFVNSQNCNGLLVNYGASQLTSISTWISTTATLLAPAYMALLSYPIAKSMTYDLQKRRVENTLPSPYQTSLLVELLGGSLVSLWRSLQYMCSRKRARVSKLIPFSFVSLLLVVLLGVLMQLADFWLHRATDPILYQVSQPMSAAPYGRQLSQYCQNYYATNAGPRATCFEVSFGNSSNGNPPCSVVCGDADWYPTSFSQGYLLANSMPTNNSLAVIDVTTDANSSGSESVVALLPSEINSNISWTATTIGVSTSCEFITKKCLHATDGSNVWFTCESSVPPVGYNSSGPIPWSNGNAGDANSTSDAGYWLSTLKTSPSDVPGEGLFTNPWMFGLGMNIDAYVQGTALAGVDVMDNHIFSLLLCNSTTYEL